ncbi:hypothetical protein [Paraburkholderia bryophila]|uniref:hypothetical protein n=1 Tax=Paraburkholderia bryophila TaxID=420952 RepID=UPI000DCF7A2F|nr:hypothetical protein [Paraburkholderia bryophila]
MSTKKPSFASLKINAGNASAAVVPPAEERAKGPAVESIEVEHAPAAVERKVSKAKLPKTIPVRMTREQWYEAKEFAMRFDTSLQEMFIAGLNMMRASKGLPPLTGTRQAK